MIIRVILAAAVIAVAWLGIRWLRNHPAQQLRRTMIQLALYVGIAILILLAITGRLHWLIALLASLLPFLQRLLPLIRYVPFARQLYRRYQTHKASTAPPSPGQTSSVSSRFVRMTLDHADGQIDGIILEGPFRQRHLHELSQEQLLNCLYQWRQDDGESARLLSAYLDQIYGADWREHDTAESTSDTSNSSSHNDISEDESLAILGLARPLTRETIIAAHRRLMQKLHPDRGGSTYLAAKINQAKDLLLKQFDG